MNLRERVEKLREDYYLSAVADDCDWESEYQATREQRYMLLERGHYGTWVSFHPSMKAAGEYSMNQEYAEDYHAEVIFDTKTGTVHRSANITWEREATNG